MGDNSALGIGDLRVNTEILTDRLGCAAAASGCEDAEWSHWAELGLHLQSLTHLSSALC